MNASWSNCTTSLPMAFLAAKPFVHVKIFPWFRAVCSTGKLNVRPRGTAGWSDIEGDGEANGLACSVEGLEGTADAYSVKNASTESAR